MKVDVVVVELSLSIFTTDKKTSADLEYGECMEWEENEEDEVEVDYAAGVGLCSLIVLITELGMGWVQVCGPSTYTTFMCCT